MKWRIYRLPGSREIWHVDSGPNTKIVNVKNFIIRCHARSIDIGDGYPRAWIEINEDNEFHIINGIAVFDFACASNTLANLIQSADQKEN